MTMPIPFCGAFALSIGLSDMCFDFKGKQFAHKMRELLPTDLTHRVRQSTQKDVVKLRSGGSHKRCETALSHNWWGEGE